MMRWLRARSKLWFLRLFDRSRLRRVPGVVLGSVIKKRRKKMRKHKHKKMLKKTRWQRRAHA
jgi:hypothetical protein